MKTMKSIIFVTLLFGITGSAFADTDWTNGDSARLWRDASNWSLGVPTTADKAGIRNSSAFGPIIDSSTTAVANLIVLSDWSSSGDTLDITGGSLTVGGWFIIAYSSSNDGTFNVSGGVTTVGSQMDIGRDGVGHMTMTDGTVTVSDGFGIGTGIGSGDVQLDGGTISCGSFTVTSGSSMDITGGTLIVDGYVISTIDGYIGSGWITAYGGTGVVVYDYGTTNVGKTTISADPDPGTLPGDGNVNGDRYVDVADLLLFAAEWLEPTPDPDADFTRDGDVDMADFAILAANWHRNEYSKTLTDKIMSGYQGWFNHPGDGADRGWTHWGGDNKFEPGFCTVDWWPDVSEYDADELYPTGFKYANGSTASVFSSHNRKTVLRHFSWMEEYGIDGAFLQRFASGTLPGTTRDHKDQVMLYCKEGANLHKRAWAMMYDLSSTLTGPELKQRVIDDWMHLVDTYKITQDPADAAYLHHNGKPVVAVWGLGFEREYEGEGTRDIIDFLVNDATYGGCAVMIGVDNEWRERMVTYPLFGEIVQMADIISPWAVGRYGSTDIISFDDFVANRTVPDQTWCNTNSKDYLPVIFPGFSWYNLKHDDEDYTAVFDSRPRLGGAFLWRQLYKTINDAGCTMIYQAMFDEVDEGTAIFKISNDPPVSEEPTSYSNPFLPVGNAQHAPYDISDAELPTDHYLWLLGEGAKMLRGETDLTSTMPIRGTGLIEGTFVQWKMDETTGAVAADDSANGYHGTLINMDDSDWVPGNTGNALDFDGVNDYVTAGSVCTALAGRDVTVSAWIKAPALNPAMQFIIAINSSTGDNRLLCGTQAGSDTLSFADSEPVWHDTTATVIDNTWHHIAYVLEDSSNTITVYVDGSDVLTFTSTVSVAATDVLSLGQEYDTGMTTGDFYSGQLDEVRIYDRALSESEIAELAQ